MPKHQRFLIYLLCLIKKITQERIIEIPIQDSQICRSRISLNVGPSAPPTILTGASPHKIRAVANKNGNIISIAPMIHPMMQINLTFFIISSLFLGLQLRQEAIFLASLPFLLEFRPDFRRLIHQFLRRNLPDSKPLLREFPGQCIQNRC